MRAVTGNMTSVVRGMDKAMESMNLERVRSFPVYLYPSFLPVCAPPTSFRSGPSPTHAAPHPRPALTHPAPRYRW